MSEPKAAAGLMGALALLGASLGVAPVAEAQAQLSGVESNQMKVRPAESNQRKDNGVMRRPPGWIGGAGAVAGAVRRPSVDSVAGALGAISSSQASTSAGPAGGGGGAGRLASMKFVASAMSITDAGILRCGVGEEFGFHLAGEDASMDVVGVQALAPVVASSNPAAVRAAASSTYGHLVTVRCLSDGEAWITAETQGVQAKFPVLVGTARRQVGVTAPAPAMTGISAAAAAPGQAPRGPSVQEVGRAADTARSIFNAIRR